MVILKMLTAFSVLRMPKYSQCIRLSNIHSDDDLEVKQHNDEIAGAPIHHQCDLVMSNHLIYC